MATAHSRKRQKQCRETRNVRPNKHPARKSIFGEIDKTKEYSIYWLWENTTSQCHWYETSKDKLRGIVDYLQKISDINAVKKRDDQNIFLVMNANSFRTHSAQLNALNQIRSVYLYETNSNHQNLENMNDNSFTKSSKVCGPFQDLDELFIALSKNLRPMTCQPNMTSDVPPLTSASKTLERSTTVTYSYVTDWYINLIHALQEVPPPRTCRDKFIEECSLLYADNPSVLQAIREFNNTYVPEEVIRWYTRDGFLHKVLNRVLREKNQETIQLLHFLIYDLNQQLKNELKNNKQDWMKTSDTVRLYRGQQMSIEELQQLRKNKGEELFVNSFLSMTTDLAVANMFSGAGSFSPDHPVQSVIFQIEWADFSPKQGVADIHRLSFNGDENEVLLGPTFTVSFLGCVYDEKARVWNASFTRLAPMDDPLIRISDDERLMRLELTLRYLIEEKDSSDDDEEMSDTFSDSQDDQFEFTRKFCSTFVEDVPILQRELNLPELCSITINSDDSDRFELKTFRSFTLDSLDHGPKIEDEMVITLYDALGSVFKTKGKLMQAYYYYQKASTYDKPQSQTTYTRQANLAQIHKINGDYELAWNIFDELMNRTDDADNFLYEDIDFARTADMPDQLFLENSRGFLQYCSTNDSDGDDDDEGETELFIDERVSEVIDAWATLGYKYFYQLQDPNQALDCYTREKELSAAVTTSSCHYFQPLIGSCAERMGDVYASKNDIEKALTLYHEALDLSMQGTFISNLTTAARCMCKIGRYRADHDPEIFHRAFQNLIHGYGKPYTRDTIGKCYVHLVRSLQRCQRYEQALTYAKQAISIFLPDPLLLERLIDDCCQLIIELHQTNTAAPTKEQLLNDRLTLDDEQIKAILQMTLNELKNELENK